MADRKKVSIKDKLSALKPSVPTNTRAKKVTKPSPKKEKAKTEAAAVKNKIVKVAENVRESSPVTIHYLPFDFVGLPFVIFDVWRGVSKAYYGLAESHYNFLLNLTCWRRNI